MNGPVYYEIPEDKLDLYYTIRDEQKSFDQLKPALELKKLQLRRAAEQAVGPEVEFLTVGGTPVIQITRTHPNVFDSGAFRRFDPRLYQSFVKPREEAVVQFRWVPGERP